MARITGFALLQLQSILGFSCLDFCVGKNSKYASGLTRKGSGLICDVCHGQKKEAMAMIHIGQTCSLGWQ